MQYLSIFTSLSPLRAVVQIILVISLCFAWSCRDEEKPVVASTQRVFSGYHVLLDSIIRSKNGIFRGLNLNSSSADILKVEPSEPVEMSEDQLYYEYKADSITDYSISYVLQNDSLEEINVQVNTNDLDLGNYLFCDLKDYYANKLPNPTEDKGYVVYNCFEGQRKPYVVSLSDNSSPTKGIINMVIYKDK
jgi:hypothetical protein